MLRFALFAEEVYALRQELSALRQANQDLEEELDELVRLPSHRPLSASVLAGLPLSRRAGHALAVAPA